MTLPNLPIALFDALLEPLGERFPLHTYPGSALRGAVGLALRAASCTTGLPECGACPRLTECAYGLAWESGSAVGRPLPSGYRQDPPKPYVIAPAYPTPEGGLVVRLALFGRAAALWPAFLSALREATSRGLGGRQVPGTLTEARALHPTEPPRSIFRFAQGFLAPPNTDFAHPLPEWAPAQSGGRVRLRTITPLMLHKERSEPRIDPLFFTKRLTERLSLLSALYGPSDEPWEGTSLHAHAESVEPAACQLRVVQFSRESARPTHSRGAPAKSIPMLALEGQADFAAVSPSLARLWSAARAVHVGRSAIMGLGWLTLEPLHEP